MQYTIITNAIGYLIFICIIAIWIIKIRNSTQNKKQRKQYKYTAKLSIMTKSEVAFYDKLQKILGQKFYIVPQAHLGTFLDHKVPGQNWKGAFSVINRKSVDFLICEKETSKPVIAIELDDWTHSKADRIDRDNLVNQIINDAGLLLVRFKEGEWDSEDAILQKIWTDSKLSIQREPETL